MGEMSVTIKLSETDFFKDVVEVMKAMVDDTRINADIRNEYKDRLQEITKKYDFERK